jgi:hypothetical protein
MLGESGVGINVLENRFQEYCTVCSDNIPALKSIAVSVSLVQKRMRELLRGITDIKCSSCESSCCECMPVEGWFTENDYFVYRMLHNAPFSLMTNERARANSCVFLASDGCSLPEDIRPFPCVKVNCLLIEGELEKKGRLDKFKELVCEIDSLQQKIWAIIKD